jgi:hypothetical protein
MADVLSLLCSKVRDLDGLVACLPHKWRLAGLRWVLRLEREVADSICEFRPEISIKHVDWIEPVGPRVLAVLLL